MKRKPGGLTIFIPTNVLTKMTPTARKALNVLIGHLGKPTKSPFTADKEAPKENG